MGSDDKPSFWSTLPGILTGIATVITALGTAYGVFHHTASDSNQKDSSSQPQYGIVTLQGWDKRPGQTGMRAALSIDGSNIGLIDNLVQRPVVRLGRLTPGQHLFSLSQVSGFEIGPAGQVGPSTFQNGTCSNQFAVSGDEEVKSLAVHIVSGKLICNID